MSAPKVEPRRAHFVSVKLGAAGPSRCAARRPLEADFLALRALRWLRFLVIFLRIISFIGWDMNCEAPIQHYCWPMRSRCTSDLDSSPLKPTSFSTVRTSASENRRPACLEAPNLAPENPKRAMIRGTEVRWMFHRLASSALVQLLCRLMLIVVGTTLGAIPTRKMKSPRQAVVVAEDRYATPRILSEAA